jgi:hypothetical protein
MQNIRIIIPVAGQSIFDIAIQEYGSIEGVSWICEDNQYHVLPYNFTGAQTSDLGGVSVKMRSEYIKKTVVDELRPYNPIISKA